MIKFGSIIHKGFVGLAFFILTIGGLESVSAQADETAVVNRFMAKQAKQKRAEEYQEARKIVRGDVNGDKKPDLVVLYTLEGFGGGNDYVQYLAVFLGNGKTFRTAANEPVGGKLRRDVDLRSVISSTINLDTKKYRMKDAACCPSKSGKARYVFRNGKLKEIK